MNALTQALPAHYQRIVCLLLVFGFCPLSARQNSAPNPAKHELNYKARLQYGESPKKDEDEQLDLQQEELWKQANTQENGAERRVRDEIHDLQDLFRRRRASLRLVVMINALMDDLPTIGAGIVFARCDNTLLIVTANHIVRHGSSSARALQVKFKDKPSLTFNASLSEHFDPAADVAVLSVKLDQLNAIDYCAWFLRMSAALPRRGEPVYAVGNPHGFEWATSVTPEYVAQTKDDRILFQSTFVGPGHSGGALLNRDGMLLGMIESDQSPFGVALRLTAVTRILRSWGYLVELYARKDTEDAATSFESVLDEAAASGDLAAVKRLVSACPDVNSAEFTFDRPSWSLAVGNGQTQVLQFFLSAGADVNIPFKLDGIGMVSAVEWAAFRGHTDVLKLLLDHGADPFWHENGSYNAMGWAASAGQVESIKILARFTPLIEGEPRSDSPFMIAVRNNHLAAARTLLTLGAGIDHKNNYGATILDWAAYEQNLDAVAFLVNAGADVNAKDDSGKRPLFSLMNSPYINERLAAHQKIEALLRSRGTKP